MEKQPSIINMNEFRQLAVLKTNKGFYKPSETPIHFSMKYNNNKIGLEQNFPGEKFNALSSVVLIKITNLRFKAMD